MQRLGASLCSFAGRVTCTHCCQMTMQWTDLHFLEQPPTGIQSRGSPDRLGIGVKGAGVEWGRLGLGWGGVGRWDEVNWGKVELVCIGRKLHLTQSHPIPCQPTPPSATLSHLVQSHPILRHLISSSPNPMPSNPIPLRCILLSCDMTTVGARRRGEVRASIPLHCIIVSCSITTVGARRRGEVRAPASRCRGAYGSERR